MSRINEVELLNTQKKGWNYQFEPLEQLSTEIALGMI